VVLTSGRAEFAGSDLFADSDSFAAFFLSAPVTIRAVDVVMESTFSPTIFLTDL
jgi:hypothetical protein